MNPRKTKTIFIFAGIVVAAFIAVAYASRGSDAAEDKVTATVPTTPTTPVTPVQTPTPVANVPTTNKTNKYKNGTYTVTGSYESPAGMEKMGVSVTIKNDIVTASTITPEAGDGRSMNYQQRFISGYKQYVIGQSVDSINFVDSVSGSSLTPHGFNDALAKIKSEAVS